MAYRAALGLLPVPVRTQGNYLFPVRALSRHFRGQMVSLLRQAAAAGELHRIRRECQRKQASRKQAANSRKHANKPPTLDEFKIA